MSRAIVGRHCNIGEHVYVESGAKIGDRVTVKNHVLIWDGVTIEDDVFLGPGAIFTNDRHPRSARSPLAKQRYAHRENWLLSTLVRRGASIGAGAILLPGITIGRYATVGAGAVVTRDVPAYRLIVGNPARLSGWVCLCGLTLDVELRCHGCRRLYCVRADELELLDGSSKEE
jgi:acetyltransferase-like isoleucine patch superfamily enzyme